LAIINRSLSAHAQFSFSTLPSPDIFATGISGESIVGYYDDTIGASGNYGWHGFLSTGGFNLTLMDPYSPGSTYATGISGNNVVGSFYNSAWYGFIYNGANGRYTTLQDPTASFSGGSTWANGIDGNNVVGYYTLGNNNPLTYGFLFNGSSYSTINDPLGAMGTIPNGISGNNIVGYYTDSNGYNHGFLFNGNSYTSLNFPSAYDTYAYGISGNDIVGTYTDASGNHGFIYDGSSYITLDDPSGVGATYAYGISGPDIVGYFDDPNPRGFLATDVEAPEPLTIQLSFMGWIALIGAFIKRRITLTDSGLNTLSKN
jgi:hypothetical protein